MDREMRDLILFMADRLEWQLKDQRDRMAEGAQLQWWQYEFGRQPMYADALPKAEALLAKFRSLKAAAFP